MLTGGREAGITGYVVIGMLIVIAIALYSGYLLLQPSPDYPGGQRGLVAWAAYQSGDSVRVYGNPAGYPSVSGAIGGVGAVAAREDPRALGFLMVPVTPLVGDFAIDTDRMGISIVAAGRTTQVKRSTGLPLWPGNWTIAAKHNMIPMHAADDDNILEAGEMFDLLISLPEPLSPYQEFSIVLSPERGMPYTQKFVVPPSVAPVARFGWC